MDLFNPGQQDMQIRIDAASQEMKHRLAQSERGYQVQQELFRIRNRRSRRLLYYPVRLYRWLRR
jgi:hypothetical protein